MNEPGAPTSQSGDEFSIQKNGGGEKNLQLTQFMKS